MTAPQPATPGSDSVREEIAALPGVGEQQRERVARWLFAHDGSTPSAWDRLLNDAGKRVWLRYADELLALLDRTQPDGEPEPCRVYSHGADGWHCEHRAGHDGGHRNGEVEW